MFSFGKHKRIYLDYASATPVSDGALKAYVQATHFFANPGSLYTQALEAREVYHNAKKRIAHVLGVKASELVVVSGGTEGNNLALAGFLHALEASGRALDTCEVVISSIEHPSVRDVFVPLVDRGLRVVTVDPNERGAVTPEAVSAVLSAQTVLVSVGLVNSEIGTVQPLHAISKAVKAYREDIVIHTDACQGAYRSLVVGGLGVDVLVVDSGKMYGPRGIGCVYVKQGVTLAPVVRGGAQEDGLRGGTENTALLAGFAQALCEVHEQRSLETQRLQEVRDTYLRTLCEEIDGVVINGTHKQQSPHIVNISIPHIDAEYVLYRLDKEGIAFSTKSSCLEQKDTQHSHVVAMLGGEKWRPQNALRLSFGRSTKEKDVARVVGALRDAVAVYRKTQNID